jgi:hypothetical protein
LLSLQQKAAISAFSYSAAAVVFVDFTCHQLMISDCFHSLYFAGGGLAYRILCNTLDKNWTSNQVN